MGGRTDERSSRGDRVGQKYRLTGIPHITSAGSDVSNRNRPARRSTRGYAAAMADAHPTPESKNWTWVLDRPCDECGYVATDFERSELGAMIRSNAAAWRATLGRGSVVTERPPVPDGADIVWSGLEYGAHVRDVYEVFIERVKLMLKKSNPNFKDWDQNRAAIKGKYSEQDPGQVAYALASNAGKLADVFDRLSDADWERAGNRSDGVAFTIETIGRYFFHDCVHHLVDVEKGYDAIFEARTD